MKKKNLFFVVIFVFLLLIALFFNLGERPFFGVEGRWAEASREMSLRGSWFVPTLNFEPHTTKPLIPFWLIKISGDLFGYSELSVRLPGSLLALSSVILFYFLGLKLLGKEGAILSTFMYGASLGFLNFARLAQSEIYQLFGIVLALTIYVYFRNKKSFLGYLLFVLALLFSALSKGLTAVATLTLFVTIDIIINKSLYHLNWKFFLVILLGVLFYFLPYYFTSQELGTTLPFFLWFRENIKQAFDPYDNLRPFYIYLYYLPIWIAPFSLFLIGAVYRSLRHYKQLTPNEKILFFSLLSIFFLFTIVKARRDYYILPILPFSILFISFYIENTSSYLLIKIYKVISYILPLLNLVSLLLLPKLNFFTNKEIFIIVFFSFLIQVSILIYSFKINYNFLSTILLFFTLETLFFAYYQPKFSKSTEKLAGNFLLNLTQNASHVKICYLAQEEPVANFYFYAKIKEKVYGYREFEDLVKNCTIGIIRKKLNASWINLAKEKGYTWVAFENAKETSKNYYIFYNSSALNTPSF